MDLAFFANVLCKITAGGLSCASIHDINENLINMENLIPETAE